MLTNLIKKHQAAKEVKEVKSRINPLKRISVLLLILGLFVVLAVPAVKFTIGKFHYEKGRSLSSNGQYSQAVQALEKALSWQPKDAAILYELGMVHLKTALDMDGVLQGAMAAKAVESFAQAQTLNPLEPETAYGLARASELLGEQNREQTLAAYHRAVELWPNNSLYRRAFARELYRQGKEEELLATLQILGGIDPASVGQLQREPYWSDDAQQAVIAGLQQAIAQNIVPRQAHMALAAILEKQEKWPEAALAYQNGMSYELHRNTEHDFYRLGGLLLRVDGDEAVKVMLQGLAQSSTRERDLERLYNIFKDGVETEFQLGFYRQVRERFPLTYRLEILMARTLIDAGQCDAAKEILEKEALQEEAPEIWYWLARIGELTEDWDTMEIAIQKASMRDPNNSDYHLIFSRVLARQQKYVAAEEQAGRAIQTRENPSAGLYNHRAWLRWNQENYEGALEDWQEANRLQPDNAAYYGQIGRAYKMLGNTDLAMTAYTEALERDPGNERYRKELGVRSEE